LGGRELELRDVRLVFIYSLQLGPMSMESLGGATEKIFLIIVINRWWKRYITYTGDTFSMGLGLSSEDVIAKCLALVLMAGWADLQCRFLMAM
jgi:hypothetical protein